MKNVVERVKNGEALWSWRKITIKPHNPPDELESAVLEVNVMRDAMRLKNDKGQWIRFPVTAIEQQQIADVVGGIFHTERTQDERHLAATALFDPIIQVPPGSGRIVATSHEDDYNRYVDQAIEKTGDDGIVSSVGKPWTLTNNMVKQQRHGLQTAYNYGWHSHSAIYTGPGGMRVWQPVINPMSKYIHNNVHKDPSQVCEFLSRSATIIDGQGSQTFVDLIDVYQHDIWCHFVTYDGKSLKHVRQPAVPEIKGTIVLPPIEITS